MGINSITAADEDDRNNFPSLSLSLLGVDVEEGGSDSVGRYSIKVDVSSEERPTRSYEEADVIVMVNEE